MGRVRKDNDQRYVLRAELSDLIPGDGGGGNGSDTLDDVTSRGAVTTNSISVGVVNAPGGNSNEWNEAHSWGNHADANYVTEGSFYYSQATAPSNPAEGALWYNTATEDFLVYRETTPNVYNWVPLSTGQGDSDTLDGGAY